MYFLLVSPPLYSTSTNGLSDRHEKFETQGADIFHFEEEKIKEAWTRFDALSIPCITAWYCRESATSAA